LDADAALGAATAKCFVCDRPDPDYLAGFVDHKLLPTPEGADQRPAVFGLCKQCCLWPDVTERVRNIVAAMLREARA
jgi:hypothetical protein